MTVKNPPEEKVIPIMALPTALAGQPDAVLIDVRTPAEFAAAHIARARLMPLGNLDARSLAAELSDAEKVYIICQSGARARKAIAALREAGLSQCELASGGMDAWIAAGLPTISSSKGGFSILRQVQIVVGSISALGAVLALTINPLFAIAPLVMGSGLLFAGLSGTCGLALVLAKMPWNRASTCGADLCCAPESKGNS